MIYRYYSYTEYDWYWDSRHDVWYKSSTGVSIDKELQFRDPKDNLWKPVPHTKEEKLVRPKPQN